MGWRIMANVVIAGLLAMWIGQKNWVGGLIGFAAGFILISIYDLTTDRSNYIVRLFRFVRFSIYFLKILVKANLEIAWEILTPGLNQKPRILRYQVTHLTALETTVFANCITLTPGTLVVDVTKDGDFLYIHCMYAEDRERSLLEINELDLRLQREVFS